MSIEAWKKIEALDLSNIKKKLGSKKGWWWRWHTDLDAVEREYKQFLYLIAANPGQTVVPWTDKLDDLWHEHILDTAKYEKDCQEIFGRFVHHNPHLAVGTTPQVTAFKNTKTMYREAFAKKAQDQKSGRSSDVMDVGCGGVMPVVFCGGFMPSTPSSHQSHHSEPASHHGSDHSYHSSDHHSSHDSGGSSCGSSCGSSSSSDSGGSSCGSSCGGGGCGGE